MKILYYLLKVSCLLLVFSCDSNKDSTFVMPTIPRNAVKVVEDNNYLAIVSTSGEYLPGPQMWKNVAYYDNKDNLLQEIYIAAFRASEIELSRYDIEVQDYKYENDTLIAVRDLWYGKKLDDEIIVSRDDYMTIHRDTEGKIIRTETNTGDDMDISLGEGRILAPAKFYYDNKGRLVKIQHNEREERYSYVGDNKYIVYTPYSFRDGKETGFEQVWETYENGLLISRIRKVYYYYEDSTRLMFISETKYSYNREGKIVKQIKNYANRNYGALVLNNENELIDDYYEKFPLLAQLQDVSEWEYNKYGDCIRTINYEKIPDLGHLGNVKIADEICEYYGGSPHPYDHSETEYIYSYSSNNNWTERSAIYTPAKTLVISDPTITIRTIYDISDEPGSDTYISYEDMEFPILD